MTNELKDKYFFCYSLKLFDHIKKSGIPYVTKAINPKNNYTFVLYEKTERLGQVLKQYTQEY